MSGPKHLEQAILNAWPSRHWHDVTVLTGVSGGPDSVALLRALARIREAGWGGRLVVAHFNHRWRGAASDADQQFVERLCTALDVECRVGVAEKSGPAGEAAARAARYAFFERMADDLGARYIATAHTADDQAETVLHRVLRGTSVHGLAGIAFARPLHPGLALIRPLLAIRREEIDSYLRAVGQTAREDSSNQDPRWTRNRLRKLLPQLAEDYNPQVIEALNRLAGHAREHQAIIDELIEPLQAACRGAAAEHQVVIPVVAVANTPRRLACELIRSLWRERNWPEGEMSARHWEQLADLIPANPTQQWFPGNVRAVRTHDSLRLDRIPT